MSRADEIAQGLREPSGTLTFCLVVEEYAQAHIDFENGTPAPRMSSHSYDLGRARAARLADEKAEADALMASINAETERRTQAVRELLIEQGRMDLVEQFDADMARIKAP